jgi:hypothetical protein
VPDAHRGDRERAGARRLDGARDRQRGARGCVLLGRVVRLDRCASKPAARSTRAAASATASIAFTPTEKLAAQSIRPPAARTSASSAGSASSQPVVPTTTGQPAATQARTLAAAAPAR